MKVWLIYYTGKYEDIVSEYEESDDASKLYAMTNNKDVYKSFMRTRNRDVFKVKKEDLLPSEYEELASEFRGSVLDMRSLVTRSEDGEGTTAVDLALTEHEYNISIDEDIVELILFNDEEWAQMPHPLQFKSKIVKALYTLQYITIYKLVNNVHPFPGYDDNEAPDYEVDELYQFISNFSGTLNL